MHITPKDAVMHTLLFSYYLSQPFQRNTDSALTELKDGLSDLQVCPRPGGWPCQFSEFERVRNGMHALWSFIADQ